MDFYEQLEEVIFVDPGHRGLTKLWTPGCLKKAADGILSADKANLGCVLTGFCCMHDRCETDGPLGSSILAWTLSSLGFNTALLTDSFSAPVVKAASLGTEVIVTDTLPEDPFAFVISVERPGETLMSNDYRTMRARDISAVTAPLDHLLPMIGEGKKAYFTVGIGDGGNEAGTGNISENVSANINCGSQICTKIGAEVLIMAGVSNWGALALAAALVIKSGRPESAQIFIKACEKQEEMLERMIQAGSYDGISGEAILAIDGMMYEAEHTEITRKITEIVKKSFKSD